MHLMHLTVGGTSLISPGKEAKALIFLALLGIDYCASCYGRDTHTDGVEAPQLLAMEGTHTDGVEAPHKSSGNMLSSLVLDLYW